ncbi:hypothetical protein D3C85_1933200 [compost metagenome]
MLRTKPTNNKSQWHIPYAEGILPPTPRPSIRTLSTLPAHVPSLEDQCLVLDIL